MRDAEGAENEFLPLRVLCSAGSGRYSDIGPQGGEGRVPVKVREVIARITADGWYLARTKGSHRQFKHPSKRGTVTVAGKPGADLHPDTVKSIFTQAGLR
jgi:predicted RNA binding protein YcfA (HicA-like mRNA interferase family)